MIAKIVEPMISKICESLASQLQKSEQKLASHQMPQSNNLQANSSSKPLNKQPSKTNLITSVSAAVHDQINKRKSFDNKFNQNNNQRKSLKQ